MLIEFTKYCQKEKLFKPDDKILLAVSGGVDSVVMCELFYLAGYKFGIAHCNFKLRGEESDEDEKFVRDLADKYKAKFYLKTFETKKYAVSNGISIQMAARELRYKWFEELLKSENYKYIATAHHSDDQIETFFINILRGTGIAGLHGILPKQNNIIHPLLFSNRKRIEDFRKKNNLKFREDSSNISEKYLRNKIRHRIIPLLKDINPEFEQIINKNIERFRETEKIYASQIEKERNKIVEIQEDKIVFPIKKLKILDSLSTYLYEFLSPYNFSFHVVEDIVAALDDIPGKQFFSPTHRLIKDREELIITPKKHENHSVEQYTVNEKSIDKPVNLKIDKVFSVRDFKIPQSNNIACLDYEKLKFPLILRKWKEGDYFYPLGLNSRKKLSDFFIDRKFSLLDKENAWLLCSGDKIVWIVGFRIDNRFKITKRTKKIFQIEYFPATD